MCAWHLLHTLFFSDALYFANWTILKYAVVVFFFIYARFLAQDSKRMQFVLRAFHIFKVEGTLKAVIFRSLPTDAIKAVLARVAETLVDILLACWPGEGWMTLARKVGARVGAGAAVLARIVATVLIEANGRRITKTFPEWQWLTTTSVTYFGITAVIRLTAILPFMRQLISV